MTIFDGGREHWEWEEPRLSAPNGPLWLWISLGTLAVVTLAMLIAAFALAAAP